MDSFHGRTQSFNKRTLRMSDETERKEVATRMCSRLSARVKEIDRDGACVCVCVLGR